MSGSAAGLPTSGPGVRGRRSVTTFIDAMTKLRNALAAAVPALPAGALAQAAEPTADPTSLWWVWIAVAVALAVGLALIFMSKEPRRRSRGGGTNVPRTVEH